MEGTVPVEALEGNRHVKKVKEKVQNFTKNIYIGLGGNLKLR